MVCAESDQAEYHTGEEKCSKCVRLCSASLLSSGRKIHPTSNRFQFSIKMGRSGGSKSSYRTGMKRTAVGSLFCFLLIINHVATQLIINVQNQGGEIVQETITSSVGDETCTLEFQRSDGTLITELIDFKSEVQVLKALVLGEEERGQSQYQVMCFVTKFQKGDFITADAMVKLRQKNPSTIRTPEEDRGKENYTMTGWVLLDRAVPISRHVAPFCVEAPEATYVRDVDLKAWAELPGSSISILESAVKLFPSANTVTAPSRCSDVSAIWAPCICTLEMCIGWYPCGLKYCKGKPENALQNNGGGSYRCGIKTCRKCHQYSYYVREKQQCLWDE